MSVHEKFEDLRGIFWNFKLLDPALNLHDIIKISRSMDVYCVLFN